MAMKRKSKRPAKRSRIVKRSKKSKGGSAIKRVNQVLRMIETKEAQWKTSTNVAVPHNNTIVLTKGDGGPLNPFQTGTGTDDPMAQNTGQRIGDQVSIRGLKITGFFEGALGRSKVHFRLMLIKSAKGDTITRATLFQNKSDNKMLDMVNTERYTVIWQTKFNVTPPNATAASVSTIPPDGTTVNANIGITGNRIINAFIPGRKFGRDGNIRYENGQIAQVKFYDYRLVVLAYDWFGTPQDVNTVGRINELYTCIYYKDA